MWSEQNAAGMIGIGGGCGGVGVGSMGANGKRRAGMSPCAIPPSKNARWEDSIARLEAVAAGVGGPGLGGWEECAHACRRRWGWCAGRCTAHAHETIRAENGKSYLELAAACCDGRAAGRCANRRCYRERRAKMMNLCAYKLARFRQTPDPSLRRSVLVCNTLRTIERETEREAAEEARAAAASPAPPQEEWRSAAVAAVVSGTGGDCDGGRATPYPHTQPAPDCDSGYGDGDTEADEERARPIDWGSVLSLGSQSALDPLNNSPQWDAADEWPWREDRDDPDSFVHLLVGTS